MIGFIVASVNKNAIKHNTELINEMIKYTPVLCEKEEEINLAFIKQYPLQTILMAMPIEILRTNIKYIDELANKKGLEIS